MSKDLTFYTNPMSRGRIVRWMLEEAGADYDTHLLGYGTTMKDDDYLAVNPMGKVPAIRHQDRVVTECAAICAYLADMYPDAGLAPTDDERASYYRWLFFTSGPMETAISNRMLQVEPTAEQQRMVGYGNFDAVMDTMETAVSANPYIAGDRFTAADVYVGSQIGWGLQFKSIEPRPAFQDYWSRLENRPARLRADELDNAAMAEMNADN